MKPTVFTLQLLIFTAICAAVLFGGIHQVSIFQSDQYLSIIGMVMFNIYTIGLYILSTISMRSPNKGMFTAVHIGTIFFKMVLTIAIAMMYKKNFGPESRYYILPFIMIYVAYTAYETHLMMRISNPPK